MQIIIGGAYNGKRKYVAEKLKNEEIVWCSDLTVCNIQEKSTSILAITEIEKQIQPYLMMDEKDAADKFFAELLKNSVKFKEIYVIIEDIGRGIVPELAEKRKMRDVLGRLYQHLFAESQSVTRIWYGLPQKIK